uniref:Uncharacterized protein n=1 Tax=Bursaphelenchus xylophilus TaxID=6326 RepID=A0A1I7SGW5_BURXY
MFVAYQVRPLTCSPPPRLLLSPPLTNRFNCSPVAPPCEWTKLTPSKRKLEPTAPPSTSKLRRELSPAVRQAIIKYALKSSDHQERNGGDATQTPQATGSAPPSDGTATTKCRLGGWGGKNELF